MSECSVELVLIMGNTRVKVEVRTSRINISKDMYLNVVTKVDKMRDFVPFTLYTSLLYLSKITFGIL